VAGTHGKSTCTAMAAEILVAAGFDPTVVYGAVPMGATSGGRFGRSRWMLAEACEYRSNFRHLKPQIAVLLGIEMDHFDCFSSPAELEQAFAGLRDRCLPTGWCWLTPNAPPPNGPSRGWNPRSNRSDSRPAPPGMPRPCANGAAIIPARSVAASDWSATSSCASPDGTTCFNALAAAALASHCGAPGSVIRIGLERFAGLRRRLELVGEAREITVLDDYAHHPTEITATLNTVRQMYPGRPICCVFQPHQASRTQFYWTSLPIACKLRIESSWPRSTGPAKPPPPRAKSRPRIWPRGLVRSAPTPATWPPQSKSNNTSTARSKLATCSLRSEQGILESLQMTLEKGFEHCVKRAEPLAPHTWFHLGGPAEFFAEPHTVDELQLLVRRCRDEGVPVRLLGAGPTSWLRDEGVAGMVIRLSAPAFNEITVGKQLVSAGGGAKLGHAISTSVREGLAGLETLVGIPGTVGGALHGNAGSRGGDLGQWTCQATVMTRAGEILERTREELVFAYRESSLDELVILSAQFQLEQDNPEELTKRMQKQWIVKKASQPLGHQSAGCIFKNPRGMSAGMLIEQAGLKICASVRPK